MDQNLIIKRPIITEKSLADVSLGIFTFEVDRKSNKFQIKKEIEKLFSVHVKRVSTSLIHGKTKIVGRKRKKVAIPDMKKARVKLEKNEKISLFEVGGTK